MLAPPGIIILLMMVFFSSKTKKKYLQVWRKQKDHLGELLILSTTVCVCVCTVPSSPDNTFCGKKSCFAPYSFFLFFFSSLPLLLRDELVQLLPVLVGRQLHVVVERRDHQRRLLRQPARRDRFRVELGKFRCSLSTSAIKHVF